MKSEIGFTLIELLIVIAIIGIIAAIAVPNLIRSRASANETAAIGGLRQIAAAQTRFFEHSGLARYAVDLEELQTEGYLDDPIGYEFRSGYDFSAGADTESFNIVASPS